MTKSLLASSVVRQRTPEGIFSPEGKVARPSVEPCQQWWNCTVTYTTGKLKNIAIGYYLRSFYSRLSDDIKSSFSVVRSL